jgi:hypothetical protein
MFKSGFLDLMAHTVRDGRFAKGMIVSSCEFVIDMCHLKSLHSSDGENRQHDRGMNWEHDLGSHFRDSERNFYVEM